MFFEYFSIRENTRIGVLGSGTLKALEAQARKADFVPGSSDPEEAITEFCELLKPSETVLIPRSEISLQRFKRFLSAAQLIDFTFYSNTPAPPENQFLGDVLIFTSPSNARAYFSKFDLLTHQRVVAIGQSTFDALQQRKTKSLYLSDAPTEEAMWAAALRKNQ
jgi:uroporphyrinogen-III synthase